MVRYNAPGVYVEEVSLKPRGIAQVETAIPAFIGFTQRTKDKAGNDLTFRPVRVSSLKEYVHTFGRSSPIDVAVNIEQTLVPDKGKLTEPRITLQNAGPLIADFVLYYSLQLYFSNGGSYCYVVSIGAQNTQAIDKRPFFEAFDALDVFDAPTLYAFPDAVSPLGTSNCTAVDIAIEALARCTKKRDRFAIIDVPDGISGKNDTVLAVGKAFRNRLNKGMDKQVAGAAYYPYLDTGLTPCIEKETIIIAQHDVIIKGQTANTGANTGPISAGTRLSELAQLPEHQRLCEKVTDYVSQTLRLTLPPSAAIAGIYCQTDARRGVWKAPVNVALNKVVGPAIDISDEMTAALNDDPATRISINAIRTFSETGTVPWGARTLRGVEPEGKYIPARRFMMCVEASLQKGLGHLVFEPNDKNTWLTTRTTCEHFLTLLWREGAFAGDTPEKAFYVKVGLHQTMTQADIDAGNMLVEIGMALTRPAEFAVLTLGQKMSEP